MMHRKVFALALATTSFALACGSSGEPPPKTVTVVTSDPAVAASAMMQPNTRVEFVGTPSTNPPPASSSDAAPGAMAPGGDVIDRLPR